MGERDQRAEQRDAADKGFGAVDRVEHPNELGVLAHPAIFLADNPVRREPRFDQLPHRRLGRAIGNGDRRQIGLVVNLDRGAKMRADRRPRGIRQLGGEREASVEVGRHRQIIFLAPLARQASPADRPRAVPTTRTLPRGCRRGAGRGLTGPRRIRRFGVSGRICPRPAA